jgi:hypothetical protein
VRILPDSQSLLGPFFRPDLYTTELFEMPNLSKTCKINETCFRIQIDLPS